MAVLDGTQPQALDLLDQLQPWHCQQIIEPLSAAIWISSLLSSAKALALVVFGLKAIMGGIFLARVFLGIVLPL